MNIKKRLHRWFLFQCYSWFALLLDPDVVDLVLVSSLTGDNDTEPEE